MQYATASDGSRKEAFKGAVGAKCPLCKTDVVPKTGRIKTPHWAHKTIDTCDRFSEPETKWHREWKNQFPEEWREVVIGNHRADISFNLNLKDPKRQSSHVIEFQHSSISHEKICDRSRAYGRRLTWVVDASSLAKRLEFTVEDEDDYYRGDLAQLASCWDQSAKSIIGNGPNSVTVWWKHFSGAWNTPVKQHIIFDFPDNNVMFDLSSYFTGDNGRCYGKGDFLYRPDFLVYLCGLYDSDSKAVGPLITDSGLDIKSRTARDESRASASLKRKAAAEAARSGDWSDYYGD